MKMVNIGNIVFVVGLVLSSYAFSRGVPAVGLFFILVMISGLLMNPPSCKTQEVKQCL